MKNNFYNCFEHAIEKNISCTLPWRPKENSRRICETSLGFKRWYDAYKDAGEQVSFVLKKYIIPNMVQYIASIGNIWSNWLLPFLQIYSEKNEN